ncbi:unnamed protein product [Arctogadus glacialis]
MTSQGIRLAIYRKVDEKDIIKMTKTGKPDSHWAGVMTLYAQGKYKFSTGQRPGGRRWRAVIQRINACPLTPVFNQTPRKYDIFGKRSTVSADIMSHQRRLGQHQPVQVS